MNKDPKRYYAKLGVTPNASAEEIKNAFRRRAMDVHPDRNPSPDATNEFQEINEAYEVLANASRRAQYDSIGIDIPEQEQPVQNEAPDPIVCSRCGKITAQPRYAVFYQVVSYVLGTTRSGVQGIFCRACASKAALKASLVTWVAGWWGFPWGPIYSIHAIFTNLFGGEQVSNINARLMAHQAWYFAFNGNVPLARSVGIEALEVAAKIKSNRKVTQRRQKLGYETPDEKTTLLARIGAFVGALDDGTPIKRLKAQWKILGAGFYQQGAILFAVVFSLVVWESLPELMPQSRVEIPPSPPRLASRPAPAAPPTAVIPRFTEPPHSLPTTGYYETYWQDDPDALAPLKLTTKAGSTNYYIKVVNPDTRAPILTAFVRAGETASLEIPLGTYRIKYAVGQTWYGEKHLFGPDTAYGEADDNFLFHLDGNRVVGHRIELYAQIGGNLKTKMIRAADF